MAEDFSEGAAFVDETYVPIAKARVPILDAGFIRSDCTYDVVSVWDGKFFRLADHLERFERGMTELRLSIGLERSDVAGVLAQLVRLSGLRDAYVEMIATRGVVVSRDPASSRIVSMPMRSRSCGSRRPPSRRRADCT